MKIMAMFSLLMSAIYSMGAHPVILMALILTQAVLICLASWISLKLSWFSYILFLIFLGGLMVLFIYITSLASNEKVSLNMKNVYYLLMILTLACYLLSVFNFNSQQMFYAPTFFLKTFYFMYSWSFMVLIVVTMVYLLLTLVIVVKIANKFEAPIKNLIFK